MTQWLKYCASNQKVRGSNQKPGHFYLDFEYLKKRKFKEKRKFKNLEKKILV